MEGLLLNPASTRARVRDRAHFGVGIRILRVLRPLPKNTIRNSQASSASKSRSARDSSSAATTANPSSATRGPCSSDACKSESPRAYLRKPSLPTARSRESAHQELRIFLRLPLLPWKSTLEEMSLTTEVSLSRVQSAHIYVYHRAASILVGSYLSGHYILIVNELI